MSAGDFIVTEANLRDRDAWLTNHESVIKQFLVDGIPCIIFAFQREASADRLTTRIGGLPYWPSDLPWPSCRTCLEPLAFAAQLDFRHKSIRPTVPGDVLTFHYCFDCRPWSDDGEAALLTWHTFDKHQELIDCPIVPDSLEDDEPGPAYGVPLATIDYETPAEAFGRLVVSDEKYTYLQFTLQGTKIGGYPPPIQRFEIPCDGSGQPMRFVGTIGSLQANQLPRRKAKQPACGDLMWGDMGSVYIWMSDNLDDPQTTWFLQCY